MDKLMERAYKALERSWIFTTFVIKCSAVWYSLILTFFGNGWLININAEGEKRLTILGLILSLLLLIVNICVPIIEKYHERHNSKKEEYDAAILKSEFLSSINQSVNSVCHAKLSNQIKKIIAVTEGEINAPEIYTEPCEQLQKILDKLSGNLCDLVSNSANKLTTNDISINLMYNFPKVNNEKWIYADTSDANILPIDRIVKENSTFKYLLESEEPYVFYNSKQKALENKHYIKDRLDKTSNGKLLGSIACFLLEYGNDSGVYIRAVLTIMTHRKQIIYEKAFYDEPTKGMTPEQSIQAASNRLGLNIDENLIDNYSKRIGIELCNYYMQFLRKKADEETQDEK